MRTVPLATAALLTSLPLIAQSWSESTPFLNAGELPITAQATRGSGTLAEIVGTLASNENADLYVIYIDDPATFSCSCVGGANFDSQMWLFDVNGVGRSFRDDDPGSLNSTLTGQFVLQPGSYIIGISRYDNDALDSNGLEIWNDQPYATERLPDGPGSTLMRSWSGPGTGNTVDSYTLRLTGASYALKDPFHAWAYVRMNAFSAPSAPANSSFSSTGERIFVTKIGTGQFEIDLGDGNRLGALHATAVGNHVAVVESVTQVNTPTIAKVRTFAPNGTPADGDFFVVFRAVGEVTDRQAFCIGTEPTNPNYTPTAFASYYNGNRGAPTIQRLAVGTYRVTFPGLSAAGLNEAGHCQVSAVLGQVAQASVRARVFAWGDSGPDCYVVVETRNAVGALSDERFVLNYHEKAAPLPENLGCGAHVWANNPTLTSYTPANRWTDSNGVTGPADSENITRTGVGAYRVELPNIEVEGACFSLTPHGPGDLRSYISSWAGNGSGGTNVDVQMIDSAGNPADGRFNLYATNHTPAGNAASNKVFGTPCADLVLSATTRPVLGGSWDLELLEVPPPSVIGLVSLGVNNPAIPLAVIGAPGCFGYQDQLALSTVLLPAVSPAYSLNVPAQANLIGFTIIAQGAVFAPGINAFGLATSNGIEGVVGDV